MNKKNAIILSLLLVNIFLLSGLLFPQLPEWKFYRDRDGNEFFIDKNGKIWTPSKPVFKYKAVSLKGINYYLAHAKELIGSFYISEGLSILKSIIAMPVNNNLIRNAQIEAVKEINKLQKNNGKRYNKINEEASIILFKKNGNIILFNDLMRYEFLMKSKFEIVRKKIKNKYRYKYHGITIGAQLNNDGNNTKKKYKYLIAMDSEKFSKKIIDIEHMEMSWRSRLGFENFKEKVIIKEKNRKIYLIENKVKPFIKGYEGFFVNNEYTHIVRIITSRKNFIKNKNEMKNMIFSIKVH